MGFLLAKILILLVGAAVCGAAFAYWWFRRYYEDVTLEYTRSRDEWTSWRRSFEERLAARPAVDLQPLAQQIAGVDAAVRAINIPDLEPISQRLDALEKRVAGIAIPEPKDVDLNPALQQLTAIDTAVRAISITPITSKLQQLQAGVDAIRIPDSPAPVDLAPTQARLDLLEQAVRSIHVPPSQNVDLNPVLERLSALQTRLENPPAPPAPQVAIRGGSKNLLSHAGHGRPDDLKQIRGVKRVLERTLHKVGVYYFWQIAEWSPEDVRHVDSVLPAFKGRIERDDWVTQANQLATQPTAAKPPGDTEH
jgi:predicted flap endonuclease-1-like 5' DNA nuclease